MTDSKPKLEALGCISPEMKKRLRVIIEQAHPNFVLVGSDPSEEGGCCPSTDVGHANALVRAGILESWQAGCGKEACPGTFYAFRGERVPDTAPTEFNLNEELRALVAQELGKDTPAAGPMRKGLTILLLLFVAVCVGILIVRETGGGGSTGGGAGKALNAAAASVQDGFLVSVVKTAPGCSSCETMEANAKTTLGRHFADELRSGRVLYASIAAHGDENRSFRKKQEILATSLVLMEVKAGEIVRHEILSEIWQVLNNEDAFVALLKDDLRIFIEGAK